MAEERVPLSEREMEILRLVATGATNQQIAQELVISVNTVKVHLRNIYEKLGVASRTEATMLAVRQGWVQVPRAVDEGEVEPAPVPDTPILTLEAALPPADHWVPVPVYKQVSLVLVMLLALVTLAVPLVRQGRAREDATNPISEVFPTPSTGSSTARWHTRAQMPTPRTGLAAVEYQGQIYAIGGVSNDGATGKVEVYDPQADVWTTRSPKPTPVGFVSAAVLDNRIYVAGGIGAGQQVQSVLEIYDPVEDSWEAGTSLPAPLAAYGLAAFDGQIYLFGGRGELGHVSSVLRYDPQVDQWEVLRPMAIARGFLSAARSGDNIFVVGGYDGSAEFNSCEAYDPLTDSWAAKSPMSLPRGGLFLVPVREQLYALGGGMSGYLAFNERYDPAVDAWSPIGTPVKGQWQGLSAAFVSPYIHAIGGWNGVNLSLNEAYQALFQSLVPVVP